MTNNNDTTKKVNTSRWTDRGWLANIIRRALMRGDQAEADAARHQLSELDTNRAQAELGLKAHERDRMNKRKS